MRIRASPVFNELDTWQAYKQEEPIKNTSLYIYSGGKLLRPLLQQEIQPVLRLLPEAAEATPRSKGRQAPEHHQEGRL